MNHYISVKITPALSSLLSKSNPEKLQFYAVPNEHRSFTRIPKDQFDNDYTIKLENGQTIAWTATTHRCISPYKLDLPSSTISIKKICQILYALSNEEILHFFIADFQRQIYNISATDNK
jgi:hypothetical protein